MSERYVLGLGASSAATREDVDALCDAILQEMTIDASALAALATLDRRTDHPALLALADRLGLPLTGISPKRLAEAEARLETPSAVVAARAGLAGIAEAAALVLAGDGARLAVSKRMRGGVTMALARAAE